jgi:hypothetical protein
MWLVHGTRKVVNWSKGRAGGGRPQLDPRLWLERRLQFVRRLCEGTGWTQGPRKAVLVIAYPNASSGATCYLSRWMSWPRLGEGPGTDRKRTLERGSRVPEASAGRAVSGAVAFPTSSAQPCAWPLCQSHCLPVLKHGPNPAGFRCQSCSLRTGALRPPGSTLARASPPEQILVAVASTL